MRTRPSDWLIMLIAVIFAIVLHGLLFFLVVIPVWLYLGPRWVVLTFLNRRSKWLIAAKP
jgi:hypothetical protein